MEGARKKRRPDLSQPQRSQVMIMVQEQEGCAHEEEC